MKLITNIIIEYLKHNKRIVVPKLGVFIVKADDGRIVFSELMRGDNTTLRSLLMAYGMSELEAQGSIDRLVFEVRHGVNTNGSYVIENFGLFYAGVNNNILFKQHREPITTGGNIKPPFEYLNEVKRQMRLAKGVADTDAATKSGDAARTRTKRTASRATDEGMNITKPESYLRGLKYQNKKDKGHDDDYYRKERGAKMKSRRRLLLIAIALMVVVVGLVWYFMSDDEKPKMVVDIETPTESIIPQDTIITVDTMTMVDNSSPEVVDIDKDKEDQTI